MSCGYVSTQNTTRRYSCMQSRAGMRAIYIYIYIINIKKKKSCIQISCMCQDVIRPSNARSNLMLVLVKNDKDTGLVCFAPSPGDLHLGRCIRPQACLALAAEQPASCRISFVEKADWKIVFADLLRKKNTITPSEQGQLRQYGTQDEFKAPTKWQATLIVNTTQHGD